MTIEGLVALALGVAYMWPPLRLLANPAFRRVAPRVFSVLLTLVLLFIGVIGVACWQMPRGALVVAIAVLPFVLAFWWRGRESFGRRRNLPPGSLSFWRSVEAVVDRDFYQLQEKKHGSVFKMSQFHRGVICVVGLEGGHRLMLEQRHHLGPSTLPFNREVAGGFLRYMDDDTHRKFGPMFRTALGSNVVMASEPGTRQAVRDELSSLVTLCSEEGSASPESNLDRVVSRAFLSTLFGVHSQSEAYLRFEELYPEFKELPLGKALDQEVRATLDELRRWVREQSKGLKSGEMHEPSLCALGELIEEGETEPDPVVVDNLLFIHKISTNNVVALLRWLLKMLTDHPEWSKRLREELDSESHTDLSERIVKETLRLVQSEYLYRDILEDFEFDGVTLPKGWLLRLCVRESHCNPQVFHNANGFDPDRFAKRSFDRSEYSPFGIGPHSCNGVHLTLMICRSFVEELVRGFDWSIVQSGPDQRELRHWAHWRPNRNLTVSMTKLPAVDLLPARVRGLE